VLALRGANVGMACRSQERATAVVEDFARDMGRGVATRCDVLPCDLTDMTSVRNLAATLVAAGRPIDVLLLTAGVSNQPYSLTADGIEATFAANYLGHFCLLHLLADGGALAPAARIVTPLSSAVHANPVGSRRRRHAHPPGGARGPFLSAPREPKHEGDARTDGA